MDDETKARLDELLEELDPPKRASSVCEDCEDTHPYENCPKRAQPTPEPAPELRRRIKSLKLGFALFEDWIVTELGPEVVIKGMNFDIETRSIVIFIQHPKFEIIPEGDVVPRILPYKDSNKPFAISLKID